MIHSQITIMWTLETTLEKARQGITLNYFANKNGLKSYLSSHNNRCEGQLVHCCLIHGISLSRKQMLSPTSRRKHFKSNQKRRSNCGAYVFAES
jgi:hypothetical protein